MGTVKRQVVGYVRVSTQEQGDSGAGLAAQLATIRREVKHHRWNLVEMYQDVASGSSRERRPQLEKALQDLRDGRADTLVVSKLDRLSRSVADFGAIIEESRREGWTIVIIDLGVDLATPAGEMVASIMAVLAQWERRVISQRTIDALREKKLAGVRLGRPVGISPDTESTIRTLKESGMGSRAIARQLNELGLATSQGAAMWRASAVEAVLRRIDKVQH